MIIIDGHNLIGAFRDLRYNDPQVKEKLLTKLAVYQKIMDCKMIVAFDGRGFGDFERSDFEKIEVRFPPQDQTADDVIKKLINKYRNQHKVRIVSSDREIKDQAQKAHLASQGNGSFARELEDVLASSNEETERYLSPMEVEKWARLFRNKKE